MERLLGYNHHSGGAEGSDVEWGRLGRVYGVKSNHYYVYGFNTPFGNSPVEQKVALLADDHLLRVNEVLHRTFPTKNLFVNNLLRRNWIQVVNSEAVFAIADIKKNIVQGGTGWAVHMAILEHKPVYVYDQSQECWFTWSERSFKECEVPSLTKDFAGIGTRELNEKGIKAIKDVYYKTSLIESL